MSSAIVKLGAVAKFVNGKAFKPSDWSEIGLPIIRIQNLNDKGKDFNYWDGSLDKQVLVNNGNLLLAWSGTPGTSFGAHIWNGEKAVLNQHIFRVDVDEKRISKQYAKLAINAKLNKLIEMAHGGSGLQHVTKGMVEGLEISLPPLAEQQRIAALLDTADRILKLREQAIAKLDALAQSIFVECCKNSVLQSYLLGDVAYFYAGNSLPEGVEYISQDDGYFLMKVSDMNLDGNEKYVYRCKEWTSVKGSNAGTCPSGSIVIPKRGGAIETNKKRITTRPTVLDPNLMAIKADENFMTQNFLMQWFLKFDLASIANGSSVPQLNKKDLAPLKILVPPLSAQINLDRISKKIEKNRDEMKNCKTYIEKLFHSLQHQSFAMN